LTIHAGTHAAVPVDPGSRRRTAARLAATRALAWARSAVGLLVLIAVVDYLVLPRMAGTEGSLRLLRRVDPWWVGAGIAFEAISLLSYSLSTRSVLRRRPPGFGWLLRSDLTGYGLGHIVPGGGATATALRYRLLISGGAAPTDVAAAIAVQGVGCAVSLAAILWIALIPNLVFSGPTAPYLIIWLIGAVLAGCGVVATRRRSRMAAGAATILRFALDRLPRRWRPRAQQIATQLLDLLSDRDVRRSFLTWATLNWLLDAAALWFFLIAYGHPMNPASLLLAYSIASLLAVLPITPGGLGIIEGVLIPGLIGFGAPAGVAVLAVVSWRLFQFWIPVPVAGLCYLSLRTPGWRERVAATSQHGASR
jgi:putative heme transporter